MVFVGSTVPKISLLYVDDEPELLTIGTLFLEREGEIVVTTALNAPEAIGLLSRQSYDAIVSDYQMHGMDGLALLKHLKAAGNTTPFIIFTGKGREEVVIEALNEGADFYLQKGGNPMAQFAELSNKIRYAVNRKRTEESLRTSEERYRNLIETSHEAIVVAQDGMLRRVNRRALEATGYAEEELLSMPFLTLIHPDDREVVADRYRKRISGEEAPLPRYTVRLIRKDGSIEIVEIDGIPIDWEGSPATLNFLTDITARRRAEEAAEASEARYRALFGTTRSGVAVYEAVDDGTDFVIRDINPAAEAIESVRGKDVVGKRISEVFPGVGDPGLLPALERVWRTGEPERHPVSIRRDGRVEGWRETVVYRLPSGEVVAVSDDVTHPKQAEAPETSEDVAAMREAEQSLRESEQRYYNIIEDQTEFVCRFRPDGTHAFVNKAYADYFGTAREALIGHVFRPEIHPEDREKVRQFFASLTPDHPVDLIEQRCVTPGGEVRWQRWSDRAIFDTTGAVVEYQSVGRDVTQQKLAGAALADSESFNRGLVENLPDYIVVCTHDGEILFVNPAMARAFDCRAEDLVGTPYLSHIAEEHRSRAASSMAARREGRETPPYETDILLRDGSRRSAIVKGAPIQYRNRPALLLVLSDITERRLAEETQHQLAEFQRSVITNAQVWLSVFDREGTILMWNRAAEEISGYGADEVLGKNEIWERMYPEKESLRRTADTIARLVRDGKAIENLETPVQSRQGEKRVISWNITGLPDATGDVSRYIAIGVDVTDRHLAEEALRQANKQVNLLSSITRHDILNQLMVLKGYLQFSLDVLDDKKTLADFLERELRAADLIEEQIMFTRDYQEMGANAPEWQNVSVSVARARAQLSMHGIDVSVDRSDLEIFVDPLFERVFYNLFDNALRHGGDRMTTIRISTRRSGQDCLIVYEDDGVGVSPEDRPQLFMRGFGKNTGLGLFLSREILGITGISICENGEHGKGARFEIAVPEGGWRFAGAEVQEESKPWPASGSRTSLSDGIR